MKAVPDAPRPAYAALPPVEILSYALGDAGFNFYWAPMSAFLMIYMTDVVGLGMATVALLVVVMRFVGAVADPLFAAIIDRTHTDYGRYRPWFLWLALPLAASGVLAFSTSGLPANARVPAVFASIILFNLIYTAANVAYNALSGVITSNSKQRELLLSIRFFGAFLTAAGITWLTPKLVAFTGAHQEALGWQFAMTLFGVSAALIMGNLFLHTRERLAFASEPRANPLGDIKDLVTSRPWMVLFIQAFLMTIASMLHTGLTPYYVKYLLGRADLVPVFIAVFTGGLAVGSGLSPVLTRWLDQRQAVALMLGLSCLCGLGFYVMPAGRIELNFVLQALCGTAFGTVSTLTFAMYGDTADFNAVRTGHRATAMTFSGIMFSKKIAAALAAAMIGWGLTTHGFTANVAASPAMLTTIRLLFGIAPAALSVLGAGAIAFYNLNVSRSPRGQVERVVGAPAPLNPLP
jgi:GPH family glycoside/pentoside/hexuronide:cation symporter